MCHLGRPSLRERPQNYNCKTRYWALRGPAALGLLSFQQICSDPMEGFLLGLRTLPRQPWKGRLLGFVCKQLRLFALPSSSFPQNSCSTHICLDNLTLNLTPWPLAQPVRNPCRVSTDVLSASIYFMPRIGVVKPNKTDSAREDSIVVTDIMHI